MVGYPLSDDITIRIPYLIWSTKLANHIFSLSELNLTGTIRSPARTYLPKVNNRNTITRRDLYCWLQTYFTPYSSVSIVKFEHVNAGWVSWDLLRRTGRCRRWLENSYLKTSPSTGKNTGVVLEPSCCSSQGKSQKYSEGFCLIHSQLTFILTHFFKQLKYL